MVRHFRAEKMKTLIFGADGMDYGLFHDYRDSLPFFDHIATEGAFGMLTSDSPMSPPAWTTIFTGIDGNHHHVTNFSKPMSHAPFPLLWDIANDYGLSCGCFSVPMTFSQPVQRLKAGWLVAGFPRPFIDAHPPEVKAMLGDAPGEGPGEAEADARFSYVVEKFPEIVEAFPVDVGIAVVNILDEVGHGDQHRWRAGEPRRMARYKRVDYELERLYDRLWPELLVVVSDHGWNSLAKSRTVHRTPHQRQQVKVADEDYAYHTKEGVVFMYGDAIRAGRIEDAHTRDITPTLLQLWGIHPAQSFDGKPLDVAADMPEEDRAVVERRLKELGYIQ
jgi:predicted AlkP superfamily phosphohydrolase/phosphomutase